MIMENDSLYYDPIVNNNIDTSDEEAPEKDPVKNSIFYANIQPPKYNLDRNINNKETRKAGNKSYAFNKETRSTIYQPNELSNNAQEREKPIDQPLETVY